LGGAAERRQIVRWLAHDYAAANDRIVGVLHAALEDRDWEVRASAMIAAARLHVVPLARAVRQVELPQSSREGLDRLDRQILRAARKAVLAQLAGEPVPDEPDLPPKTPETRLAHLARCVAGAPVRWHDRIWMLIHALSAPLPESPEIELDGLAPGISVDEEGRYRLIQSGLALVWVPPLPHWLGDGIEAPARRATPKGGFWITQHPQHPQEVRRILPHLAHPAREGYWTGSWEEAKQTCAAYAALERVSIDLPAADEWEMAARGTDARQYPWGNGYEADMLEALSPWDLVHAVGLIPQWVQGPLGERMTCGGPQQLRCASRAEASETTRAGLRLVVRTGREP
jgi:hypothetical protein